MACWVEQHSDVFLRLVFRHSRAEGDCVGDCRTQVADLEVEVHHRPLGTVSWWPDRGHVVGCRLKHYEGSLGRSKDRSSWLLVADGPAK